MTILIVDDFPLIAEDLDMQIQELYPDSIRDIAHNGKDALALAAQKRYDVAFLDIDLPDIDGLTLAKELSVSQPLLNLVFVTGYSEYALDAYQVFASGFLVKPVTKEHLQSAFAHLRHPVLVLDENFLAEQYSGNNNIGSRLKEIRQMRGISRSELADQLAVTVQTISRWESGARVPDIIKFVSLANILGVTMEELVGTEPLR